MPHSVVVVEDDADTRERLAGAVTAVASLSLAGDCGNLADARAILRERAPDVLLVDLGLPDGSGLDLIRETARRAPATHIMVITVFGDETHVVDAIEAGATGYLLKDASSREIEKAILDLVAGGAPISPAVASHLLKRFKPAPAAGCEALLSERELDVLRLIARGQTYGEISQNLGIAVNTVGTHTKQIYRKLAVNSRGEAVFQAQRRGLLPGTPRK